MSKDNLGKRMKEYEYVSRNYLTKRTPVIIRIDGKTFHTFTKGMKRPFDEVLIKTMQETAKYLCENIQGCKLAYTQSDEITLLLTDYETFNTQGWFNYNIQKMVSISASMATLAFNTFFKDNIPTSYSYEDSKYIESLKAKINKALFDSRVFNIPKEEVCNCFIWRQQDATRNSINLVGQSNFSHKELNKKSCNDIQDMLFVQKGINWNNYNTYLKRGTCIIKEEYLKKDGNNNQTLRTRWIIDKDIPIFTQDRNYIERYI